jgi:hypothetical protein
MMNNKHTPGPWRLPTAAEAQRWGVHFLILDSEGGSLANAEPGFPMELGTVVANARLMAAAPELLEACRRLLKFNEELSEEVGVSAHYPSSEFARKAIAKAEEG